jgi:hypothetical protein
MADDASSGAAATPPTAAPSSSRLSRIASGAPGAAFGGGLAFLLLRPLVVQQGNQIHMIMLHLYHLYLMLLEIILTGKINLVVLGK